MHACYDLYLFVMTWPIGSERVGPFPKEDTTFLTKAEAKAEAGPVRPCLSLFLISTRRLARPVGHQIQEFVTVQRQRISSGYTTTSIDFQVKVFASICWDENFDIFQ